MMDEAHGLDTVTMTVLEVQAHHGPNGVVDITGDATAETSLAPAPPANGVVMEQQQMMRQQPPLYDMDLERMHTELFKGSYLTPQDFLDDVAKMVHNADVRQHEDLDRLHKAQAMYTAAQLSIMEFDPQLKIECERMAVRERLRREDARKMRAEQNKERELNGGETNGTPHGPVTRRSARTNGQHIDFSMTDPVKLERRLKRARGEEVSGDSHGSEEEGTAEGRDAKRTRIIEESTELDKDPLDTFGQTPGSEVRSHMVRFASTEGAAAPPSPSPMVNGNQLDSEMNFDSPSRQFPDSFNKRLLNPMPPSPVSYPAHPQPNYSPFTAPVQSFDPADPFSDHHTSTFDPNRLHASYAPAQSPALAPPPAQPMSFTQLLNDENVDALSAPVSMPTTSHAQTVVHDTSKPLFGRPRSKSPMPRSSRGGTPMATAHEVNGVKGRDPSPLAAGPSTPVAMVVERSPTPPLPDFHVDESLVATLKVVLKERTAGLSIEQLEQLRATCLGSVWRARKEWDRDSLVKNLLVDVEEFLREVRDDDDDDDEEDDGM